MWKRRIRFQQQSLFFGLLLCSIIVGCENRFERVLRQAEADVQLKHFRSALTKYDSVLTLEPQELTLRAAREASRIAYYEIKDDLRALDYYRYLVYHSPDATESLQAQRQVVSIYFERFANYERAIVEASKLLEIETDPIERIEAKLKIARSHYHLNRFSQARAEIDEGFTFPKSDQYDFELKLLKANVLTTDKKFSEAVILLRELMTQARERAIRENVPMTLAVCYEEMRDIKAAIAILESVRTEHSVPEYVDLRLKRLAERQKNMPGARGFRK